MHQIQIFGSPHYPMSQINLNQPNINAHMFSVMLNSVEKMKK